MPAWGVVPGATMQLPWAWMPACQARARPGLGPAEDFQGRLSAARYQTWRPPGGADAQGGGVVGGALPAAEGGEDGASVEAVGEAGQVDVVAEGNAGQDPVACGRLGESERRRR